MAGRYGGAVTFDRLRERLRKLPRTLASKVAERAAPSMTDLTQTAYGGSTDVYGTPRPKSDVDRSDLDLYRTGDARRALTFANEGTIVRVRFGTDYTKYLVGKYRVLPNGPLPAKWRATLDGIVQTTKVPP